MAFIIKLIVIDDIAHWLVGHFSLIVLYCHMKDLAQLDTHCLSFPTGIPPDSIYFPVGVFQHCIVTAITRLCQPFPRWVVIKLKSNWPILVSRVNCLQGLMPLIKMAGVLKISSSLDCPPGLQGSVQCDVLLTRCTYLQAIAVSPESD